MVTKPDRSPQRGSARGTPKKSKVTKTTGKGPSANKGKASSPNKGSSLGLTFLDNIDFQQIGTRVVRLMLHPKQEWETIKGERTTSKQLYAHYMCWIALVPAIVTLFFELYYLGLGKCFSCLVSSMLTYAGALGTPLVLAFIIDVMAPFFGSSRDWIKSLKVAIYATTPMNLITLILILLLPMAVIMFLLLPLIILICVGYCLVLLWFGMGTLKNAPNKPGVGLLSQRILYYGAVIILSCLLLAIVGSLFNMGFSSGQRGVDQPAPYR